MPNGGFEIQHDEDEPVEEVNGPLPEQHPEEVIEAVNIYEGLIPLQRHEVQIEEMNGRLTPKQDDEEQIEGMNERLIPIQIQHDEEPVEGMNERLIPIQIQHDEEPVEGVNERLIPKQHNEEEIEDMNKRLIPMQHDVDDPVKGANERLVRPIQHDVQQVDEVNERVIPIQLNLQPVDDADSEISLTERIEVFLVDDIIFAEICCCSRKSVPRMRKFYSIAFFVVNLLWLIVTPWLCFTDLKVNSIIHCKETHVPIGWILAFFDIILLIIVRCTVHLTNTGVSQSPCSIYKTVFISRVLWLAYAGFIVIRLLRDEKFDDYIVYKMIGCSLLFAFHMHGGTVFCDSATLTTINGHQRL